MGKDQEDQQIGGYELRGEQPVDLFLSRFKFTAQLEQLSALHMVQVVTKTVERGYADAFRDAFALAVRTSSQLESFSDFEECCRTSFI